MAYPKPVKNRVPEDVGSLEGVEKREDTFNKDADTMYYPGFQPQYVNPRITNWIGAYEQTPNHIDRGGYSHGIEYVDGEGQVAEYGTVDEPGLHNVKDQMDPSGNHDDLAQIYPEKSTADHIQPVRVEVVNRDDIQRTSQVVNAFIITTPTVTAQGSPTQNGLTAIRVLSADPHRVRALIGTSGTVTGTPVILGGPTANPAFGFPIPAASAQALVLQTDGEVWVSGSAAGDAATVVVLSERKYNADPKRNVQDNG